MEKKEKEYRSEAVEDSSESKKRSKKKAKSAASGSRWAAIILLIVTVLLSVVFYFQGRWGLTPTSTAEVVGEEPAGESGEKWEFKVE